MYMHIYIYTYIHIYIYTYIHISIYTYMQTYIYTNHITYTLEHGPLVCKGNTRFGRNEFPLILEEESVYIILYTIINIYVQLLLRSILGHIFSPSQWMSCSSHWFLVFSTFEVQLTSCLQPGLPDEDVWNPNRSSSRRCLCVRREGCRFRTTGNHHRVHGNPQSNDWITGDDFHHDFPGESSDVHS